MKCLALAIFSKTKNALDRLALWDIWKKNPLQWSFSKKHFFLKEINASGEPCDVHQIDPVFHKHSIDAFRTELN